MENFKITKYNEKLKQKEERKKQLEKVIDSHSLKYYGYFNIIFQMLIFLTLLITLVFSGISIYQNKRLYNYLDNNDKLVNTTSATSKISDVTSYSSVKFGLTSTNTLKSRFSALNSTFDKSWVSINWGENFSAYVNLWYDFINDRFFISQGSGSTPYNKLLNISNHTLSNFDFGNNSLIPNGQSIWTNGTDIYCSINDTKQYRYKLDSSSNTYYWGDHTWAMNTFNGDGRYTWTDNDIIYYSMASTQLYNSYNIWYTQSWNNFSTINGDRVWSDGTDIFYSANANQYIFDKSTLTWSTMTWTGLSSFSGFDVWTDGTNIYYSNTSTGNFIYNKSNHSWSSVSFTGLSSFNGRYIWTDGTDIYYNDISKSYILTRYLSTPILSISINNPFQLQWPIDSLASTYKIYKNGVDINASVFGNDGTNIYFTVTEPGTYQVQSIAYANSNYTDSSLSNSVTINNIQLDTPVLSKFSDEQPFTLKWLSIPNASTYKVYLNNTLLSNAQLYRVDNYWYCNIYDIGNYQVQAIAQSNTLYIDSSLSNTVFYSSLKIPSPTLSLPLNSTTLSWNSIYYAKDYTIYKEDNINDTYIFIATTENTTFSLYSYTSGAYVVVANPYPNSGYESSNYSNWELLSTPVLSGSYAFVGSQNYSYDNLPTTNTLYIDFISNSILFDSIIIDSTAQNISYHYKTPLVINDITYYSLTIFDYTYNVPNQYFAFNYLIQNTGNYYFISFNQSISVSHEFADTFFTYFRQATTQDYQNLGYQNGIIDSNNYTLANMFFALFDTPIIALKSLLNFNFFGVNLFALACALITLALVFAVFNLLKGSKKKGD